VITEPLWGVPYNLYSTYSSVFMLALGCSATQIGLLSSIGLALAVVLSLAGGSITDRLGRRRTTLIFDLIAWGVGTLLWTLSRNFAWFLAATIANSFVRIVQTSWNCLMVEDTPQEQRVHLFSWVYVVGVIAGLIAPVAGLFVQRFGLVPAMRGLFLFAFIVMTGMFFLRNAMVRETKIGRIKMQESRHATLRATWADYLRVTARVARSRLTVIAFLVSTLVTIHTVLRSTFLSLLLTQDLAFSDASIALFPALGAMTTLVVYLLLLPSFARARPALPLVIGLLASISGILLLILCPPRSYIVVSLSTILSAGGAAIIVPHSDTLVATAIPEDDRSKALSVFYVLLYALSSPFGYIGGLLFARSGRLAFALAGAVLGAALLLCLFIPRKRSVTLEQE
jgi:MFS transporter, DHA1 family, tetracycline resistance protein